MSEATNSGRDFGHWLGIFANRVLFQNSTEGFKLRLDSNG